jgi:hypothetical protein
MNDGFLLDTNVVSELTKLQVELKVQSRVASQRFGALLISVVSIGEIEKVFTTMSDLSRRVAEANCPPPVSPPELLAPWPPQVAELCVLRPRRPARASRRTARYQQGGFNMLHDGAGGGWPAEETAARLMKEPAKARENGKPYAKAAAQNVAAASPAVNL